MQNVYTKSPFIKNPPKDIMCLCDRVAGDVCKFCKNCYTEQGQCKACLDNGERAHRADSCCSGYMAYNNGNDKSYMVCKNKSEKYKPLF